MYVYTYIYKYSGKKDVQKIHCKLTLSIFECD